MHVLGELWQSTVGKKALVAVSGLVLWIWVVLHVLGNLTMFSGAGGDRRIRGGAPACARGAVGGARRARDGRCRPRRRRGVARAREPGGAAAARGARRRALRRALAARTHARGRARSSSRSSAITCSTSRSASLHPGFTARPRVRQRRGRPAAGVGRGRLRRRRGAPRSAPLPRSLGGGSEPRACGRTAAAGRRRPAVAVLAAAMAVGFAAVPIAVLAGWLR